MGLPPVTGRWYRLGIQGNASGRGPFEQAADIPVNNRMAALPDARITLRRPTATEFEIDTLIAISPTDTAVDLSIVVPVLSFEDEFELIISLIDQAGDTAFRGGPVIVTPDLEGYSHGDDQH